MELVLALGGNLGDVPATFAWVGSQLRRQFALLARSSLYLTEPQGPPQPPFYNAALLLEVTTHPLQLLALCQDLERRAGRDREREQRWGPRPLDLDLLLAPGLVLLHPRLELPHPRLALRRFALLPAAEVAPHMVHPRLGKALAQLAEGMPSEGQTCARVGPFPAF